MRRAYCAYVAQPNTPETDALPQVNHIVVVQTPAGDEKVLVSAAEPQSAIDRVKNMPEEEYQTLRRV